MEKTNYEVNQLINKIVNIHGVKDAHVEIDGKPVDAFHIEGDIKQRFDIVIAVADHQYLHADIDGHVTFDAADKSAINYEIGFQVKDAVMDWLYSFN